MDRFTVTAERTDLTTERTREVSVSLRVVSKEDGQVWIVMEGGPTGHESIQATDHVVRTLQTRNWVACFGARGQWDRLVVSAYEMRRFFAQAGLSYAAEAA